MACRCMRLEKITSKDKEEAASAAACEDGWRDDEGMRSRKMQMLLAEWSASNARVWVL